MAGPARRGDGGLQHLGEVQSEGRVRPTVGVEAERGSGCQRAEENCEWEGAEGARLLARTGKGRTGGNTRRTADGRRTKNRDVGWTVEIEGRQNGRTAERQTTLTFLISSIDSGSSSRPPARVRLLAATARLLTLAPSRLSPVRWHTSQSLAPINGLVCLPRARTSQHPHRMPLLILLALLLLLRPSHSLLSDIIDCVIFVVLDFPSNYFDSTWTFRFGFRS
jgi:hypothetical protein